MKEKNKLKYPMIKIKLIIIFSLLLINCEKSLQENMLGVWVIEEMTVDGKDFLNQLNIKTISFNKNKINIPSHAGFPIVENTEFLLLKSETSDSLIIYSNSKAFNGRYQMLFSIDNNDNSIYAKLISKKRKLIIHKVPLLN